MRNIKHSFTIFWLLGIASCGGPVGSRTEPQPSLAMTSASAKVNDAKPDHQVGASDFKSTKRQSVEDPVAVSFSVPSKAFHAGDTFEISVDFDIAFSYEIRDRYASLPAEATSVELELPSGFESIDAWSEPASIRSESPDGHSVYANKLTFKRQVRIANNVAPGQYSLACVFRYQACNVRQCLRPVQGYLRISLMIQR